VAALLGQFFVPTDAAFGDPCDEQGCLNAIAARHIEGLNDGIALARFDVGGFAPAAARQPVAGFYTPYCR